MRPRRSIFANSQNRDETEIFQKTSRDWDVQDRDCIPATKRLQFACDVWCCINLLDWLINWLRFSHSFIPFTHLFIHSSMVWLIVVHNVTSILTVQCCWSGRFFQWTTVLSSQLTGRLMILYRNIEASLSPREFLPRLDSTCSRYFGPYLYVAGKILFLCY